MNVGRIGRYVGLGLAVGALCASTACGPSETADTQATATPSRNDTPTTSTPRSTTPSSVPATSKAPEPDPWAPKIAKWEQENAISSSGWYTLVTGREVKSNVLWIQTAIPEGAKAEVTANPICGAYSTIVFDYPELDTVTVRTAQGTVTYRCGLGR